jgi:anti-anti-sigma factor
VNIIVERKDSVKTVRVFGDINRNELAALKGEFKDLPLLKSLIVDLAEADFAGTDFINLLVELRRTYSTYIRKFIIRNPNELIQDLLDISQMSKLFMIEMTERKKEAVFC